MPVRVNQTDLSAALLLGTNHLRQLAQQPNNSRIQALSGYNMSTHHFMVGGATVYFQGYPCFGYVSDEHDWRSPIGQPRYDDAAALFESVRMLLGRRNEWTRVNAGYVRLFFVSFGEFGRMTIWDGPRSLELLHLRDNITCEEGGILATQGTRVGSPKMSIQRL